MSLQKACLPSSRKGANKGIVLEVARERPHAMSVAKGKKKVKNKFP